MGDERQKNQLKLTFKEEDRGEAPKASSEGTESSTAKQMVESPAINERLMRVGKTRTSIREIRGRLQYLRSQSTGR
jgi:hypothetical protein